MSNKLKRKEAPPPPAEKVKVERQAVNNTRAEDFNIVRYFYDGEKLEKLKTQKIVVLSDNTETPFFCHVGETEYYAICKIDDKLKTWGCQYDKLQHVVLGDTITARFDGNSIDVECRGEEKRFFVIKKMKTPPNTLKVEGKVFVLD